MLGLQAATQSTVTNMMKNPIASARGLSRIAFAAALVAVLSACGGGDSGGGTGEQALAQPIRNCVPNKSCFTVGGSITGLTASGLVLADGAGTVSLGPGATWFTFPTYRPKKTNYLVTVTTQPTGQQCSLVNGTGVMDHATVTNISVTCADVIVSTLAGSGSLGSTDGTGTASSFARPSGVAVDSAGNLYVADSSNNKIRKISPAGVVSTVAGTGAVGSTDGTGTAASFFFPNGVASDGVGNLYVADSANNKIRKITPTGEVSTLAGTGARGRDDGPGTAASFNYPQGVAVDSAGNVYVADMNNSIIRKITPAGEVSTLAGNGAIGSVDGTGTAASFFFPNGVALDSAGNVYVADTGNEKIRKITPVGLVSSLAGTATIIGSADGTGTAASFNYPMHIATDSAGNVYVGDSANQKIRKITSTGVVSTLAGTGAIGATDGAGNVASFNYPHGIAVDTAGNVYVGDSSNNRIRKIAQPSP